MDREELLHGGESSEDFASMLEESFKKSESKILDGTIVEIQGDEKVLVDVGEKQEGILNINEIKDENGNLLYNVGDKIKVLISGFRNERPIISHKKAVSKAKTAEFIKEHKDDFENIVVEGKIVGKNKGGYNVESEGVHFFMPNSLSYLKGKIEPGRKIRAKIVKIDEDNNSIIISRKKYIEDEKRRKKEIIDQLINEDKIVEGLIKKITNYGMFVEVAPGVEGLVHYNEISYKGPVNPAKYYSEGEKVNVKALKYNEEKNRLSLSVKATMPDPWNEIEKELEVGDTINVTVSNIEPYGVFVDLGNDVEGFLHISEISWDKKVKNPKDYLNIGDEIDVEVIEIDPENRKLRVSLKRLLPKPFEEFMKKYKVGDIVKGKVTTIADFGAFVKIGNVEGLLHNQDVSWTKEKAKDILNVGDEVEVKIVKIDEENEKISLSRKECMESPLQQYAKNKKVGDIVKGKVKDIKDFGVFVEVEPGIDALIRDEDLAPLKKDELKVGDEIEGVITLLDTNRDKMRISVRRLSKIKEKEALKEINKKENDKITLGEIIKDKLNK
ncbi:30S ribosomal protein S1 [Nitrosophilus kaiyonis]|uniref:30S ribosomal protein S1 n=1 Tax=Nitrosophilus kaiyonis TaxID=2930200 RepID=UPI002490D913|nr:30S ribosomal protein S1 [Nitrosophilus kaiyonis]